MSDAEAKHGRRDEVAGPESAARSEPRTPSDAEAGPAARRITRWAVTITAALLTLGTALPAAAWAVAPAPSAGSVAAPLGTYGGTLSFRLEGVDPVVVTSTGSRTLTVAGSYTNTGKYAITDLGYKFQRGDAMKSAAAIRKEAANPGQQVTVIDSGFQDLPGTLKAGASADFSATVPVTGGTKKTLAVAQAGVYPVMININATLHLPSGPIRARVGELHLMLTVLSVPGQTGQQLPGSSTTAAIPFNMLWPIVDQPHLGVNGVFTDDDLASEIGPGGRLTNLVDALSDSKAGPDAITLVIDPMLLDELDRMSRGYWVVKTPGAPQPALTPTPRASETTTGTATGSSSAPPSSTPSTPGSGTASATAAPSDDETAVTESPAESTSGTPPENGPENGSATGASAPDDSSAASAASGADAGADDEPGIAAPESGSSETPASSSATELPGQTGQVPSTASDSATDQSTPVMPDSSGAAESGSATASTGSVASGTPTTGAPASGTATPPTSSTGSGGATTATGPGPGPRPKGTIAGTGKAAAAQFLDRLRALAHSYQVIVLPYGDPDAVALTRAGMTDDLATAVYRGRAVAARVLQQLASSAGEGGSHLVTTVADPVGGVLDFATMQALTRLGYRSAVLSEDGLDGTSAQTGAVTVALGGRSVPALVSDASLASNIGDYVYSGVPSDAATQVNLLAALMAQQHNDSTLTPMLLTPGRDWSPNRGGLSFITALLKVMDDQGVVTGTPLTAILATATKKPTVTLQYPESARGQELSAGYLETLRTAEERIGVLQEALSADPTPGGADPDDILTPLQEAMLPMASASLRDVPDPEQPVLATVNATLDGLYDGVRIHRSNASYTLASSSSPLLLTVQNALPYQVSVGVSILGGGRSGLITQDPGRIDIPAGPRTKPVKISAKVSRSGTFTVYAQLRGPHGATWGSAVPLTIASRAYGPLTLVLMLVAGGVLVLMVAFRIHQRWRGRRARLAAESGGAGVAVTDVGTDGAGGPDGDHRSGGDEDGSGDGTLPGVGRS